jgi:hypothetical protein
LNQNIEVINNNLWGVRFSLLDYIKEINILPDPEIPLEKECGRLAPNGIIILNKDYPFYKLIKEWLPRIMLKNDKQLKQEIKNAATNNVGQIVYKAMLQLETERRQSERKGVK